VLTKPKVPTIAALLRMQADARGSATVYRSLADGVDETRSVTFAELESQARSVAACLQQRATFGDRALILAEEPIEFIRAFMGCQLAGVIAVPVSPPFPSQRGRRVETLRAIAANCGARTVLSDWGRAVQARIEDVAPELAERHWIAVDEVTDDAAADFSPQAIGADDVSFLQFTSGSTSLPKGVVVTNDMVMHNQAYIERGLAWTTDDIIVNWMPLFHDMGLIGSVLPTLYTGGQGVFMSPAAFAKRPLNWLRALARYRATIGVSPDSGFRLCIEKTTPQERAALDLRSWRLAGNGAEPVASATLDAFVEAFAPAGFKASSWFVTYGLAECTLMTTGPRPGAGSTRLGVRAAELLEGRIVAGNDRIIVGCGTPTMHRRIEIVDPITRLPVGHGVVGEIWIGGPDVASHYWQRPEESERTFGATLADDDGGGDDRPFMRSGDLGFVCDDELFVVGRLKDVIIVGGRNHYPHDIEATVASIDAPLVKGACAAFSVRRDERERVVVVAEMLPARSRLGVDIADIARAIRSAIASEHGIPAEVALVDRKSVPKTSSGKLQRAACRASFERGELSRAESYDLAGNVVEPRSADEHRRELRRMLVAQIESVLRMSSGELDTSAVFQDSGLDSLKAVELRERLEDALGERLSPTMFFAHPTTDLLVEQLLDQMVSPQPTVGSSPRPSSTPVARAAASPREPGRRDPEQLDERELAAALADEIAAVGRILER
jgi:acyl-CoA synthetase (AMP-forming)/AMP-acid ligase II/acyl carrier protein